MFLLMLAAISALSEQAIETETSQSTRCSPSTASGAGEYSSQRTSGHQRPEQWDKRRGRHVETRAWRPALAPPQTGR
ncbi:hypothetical protein KCP71_16485 [Salmonella enterica subsp. enterica]|nr:hypothetical protein KCP71_16485 [Salmonella enterica subsp. enterica]